MLTAAIPRQRRERATKHRETILSVFSNFLVCGGLLLFSGQRFSSARKSDMSEIYNGKDSSAIMSAVKKSQPTPPSVTI